MNRFDRFDYAEEPYFCLSLVSIDYKPIEIVYYYFIITSISVKYSDRNGFSPLLKIPDIPFLVFYRKKKKKKNDK